MRCLQCSGGSVTVNLELLRAWGVRAQRVLYPPVCLLCRGPGQPAMDLCAACQGDLPANRLCCPRCARSLPGEPDRVGRVPCGRCIRRPPAFDAGFGPLLYQAPVDRFVQRLKFQGRLVYGRLLAELLADALIASGRREMPECLVPVPLHPRRLRARGYNQSQVIARHLGRRLGLPVIPDAVSRVRPTAPQMGLTARDRRTNLRGAFVPGTRLEGATVALVDDVMTTGATVDEVARALREGGATRIEVWCAARAQ